MDTFSPRWIADLLDLKQRQAGRNVRPFTPIHFVTRTVFAEGGNQCNVVRLPLQRRGPVAKRSVPPLAFPTNDGCACYIEPEMM